MRRFGAYNRMTVRVLDACNCAFVVRGSTCEISLPGILAVQVLDVALFKGVIEKIGDNGRSFLNANAVECAIPWQENKHTLLVEHLPLPLPTAKGEDAPFVIYTGFLGGATFPGVHRVFSPWTKLKDVSRKTGMEERRLELTIVQRQWNTQAEAMNQPEPRTMKVTIWNDQCQQLLAGNDLDEWTAIMEVHFIPVFIVCRVDPTYSTPEVIALTSLGVQWDLRAYLEKSALRVPRDFVAVYFDEAAAAPMTDVLNVSFLGQIPPLVKDVEWTFYVLTSNPDHIKDLDTLQAEFPDYCTAVFWAVRSSEPTATATAAVATAAPAKKKIKENPK